MTENLMNVCLDMYRKVVSITLGCKMFAQGEKLLETRVLIIKLSTQPC